MPGRRRDDGIEDEEVVAYLALIVERLERVGDRIESYVSHPEQEEGEPRVAPPAP